MLYLILFQFCVFLFPYFASLKTKKKIINHNNKIGRAKWWYFMWMSTWDLPNYVFVLHLLCLYEKTLVISFLYAAVWYKWHISVFYNRNSLWNTVHEFLPIYHLRELLNWNEILEVVKHWLMGWHTSVVCFICPTQGINDWMFMSHSNLSVEILNHQCGDIRHRLAPVQKGTQEAP
jgi:hypothetical protein